MADVTFCVVPIPGPAGAAGADGADGVNGISAVTYVASYLPAAQPVMPAEGANVTVNVVGQTDTFQTGQIVYVEFWGHMEVVSLPTAFSMELKNVENTAGSLYTGNSAPGTSLTAAAKIGPAGLQGPAGIDGVSGAPTDATYIVQTAHAGLSAEQVLGALATGLLRNTTATGVLTIATDGTHYLSPTTGLEPADIGVTVQGYDAMLAALAGLVTVNDRFIYFTGPDTPVQGTITAAGRALLDDATATVQRSTLGLQRTTQDILIYQHQLGAGTAGGTFTSGSWQTVPLNTEVADTGTHGSIAANTVTLATGVYRVRWRVCAHLVNTFQSRLFNVTTAGIVGLGSNAKSDAADDCMTASDGEGRITITAATEDIRIEAQCETTGTFGAANAFGGTQVYAALWLEKEVG